MNERLKDRLLPIVICAGALVMAHHQMILSGFGYQQSDQGDTRFTALLLEHAWRWLIGDPMHHDYWSPPYFYPMTGHIVWNENMLGAAPVYFPFRVLGLAPDTAYQWWCVATGALNFTATYFLLKRAFGFSTLSSAVGAAVFAFSGARINQTMHWQLFPHYFTVWAAHAAYRLASASTLTERQRVGWIFALAGATVGQLWASIYLGWYLVFVFVIGVVIGVCWTRIRSELWGLIKSNPWSLALAAVASLALLYPLGWRYLAVAGQFGGRPFNEVLTMLPTPQVWLHLGKGSWTEIFLTHWLGIDLSTWRMFQGIPMEHEQRCGFGFIATGLALYGIYAFRKQPRLLFVGVLLVVLVAMTTLYAADGSSPWRFVHTYFPGAQAIRAVSRATLVYMLGVVILFAAVLTMLEQSPKFGWLAWPLGLLLILEQGYDTPAYSMAENRRDIADVVKAIEPGCEVMVMSPVQGYGPYWKYQLDAMWAAMNAHVPTMNGYAGQNPEGWGLGDTNLRTAQDEARVQQAANAWIRLHPELTQKRICWARVGFNEGPNFASEFVSQTVPRALHAGEHAEVELTFKNLGPTAWPMGRGVRLGAETPADNTLWGAHRVELPQDVAAGQSVTFHFTITAPTQLGQVPFQWRMVADGAQWIGPMSTLALIDVQAAPPPQEPAAPDAGN